MIQLTVRQIEILESLRHGTNERKKDLLSLALSEELSRDDIDSVCQLVNDEFLMRGINPDYSPNKYGRELEQLLDVVNRPRIVHPK